MRLVLLLLLFVLALPVAAQEVGTRQRVVLTGGREIVGTVVATSDQTVVLDVEGLRTEIPRAQIVRIVDVTGRFTRTDPNYTRLFITPTARTLSRGAGRVTTYLIFPSVAYGVTGNVDVSAAASIPVDGGGSSPAPRRWACCKPRRWRSLQAPPPARCMATIRTC